MNRREFLKLIGAGAGTAALVASTSDHVINALAAGNVPPTLAVPADAASVDPIWHVLNRVTFGPRPGQIDAVKAMGLQAYLEQQLNPDNINDDAVEKKLGDYMSLDLTVPELWNLDTQGQDAPQELDSATVIRAAESQRELYQIMVHFWSEHFSMWHGKTECKFLITADNRDVIQKNALGKFPDMLNASAKSPAMLVYLDNYLSNKAHPNENYAREVMELHTVTIGNYTEKDVQELARCFTGWSLNLQKNSPDYGTFQYRKNLHDDGAKTVLGKQIPAGGGMQDAQTVLDMLAVHPATALHIASKLCRRFIQDDPPDSIVKAVQQTYLTTGGDIKSMLRTIFASQEFLNAPPKFKRPFEFLISLFRAFDADVQPINGLDSKGKKKNNIGLAPLAILKAMEHLPFNHVTPDGYTDYASEWQTEMLTRWNVAIATVYGVMPGANVSVKDMLTKYKIDTSDPHALVTYFAQHLFGRLTTPQELDAIWKYLSQKGDPTLTTPDGVKLMGDAIAMLACAPAFMFR